MAKSGYIGVSDKARKIKKGYIGVGGIARKLKKAYIGVGGIARATFSSSVVWKKYSCNVETERDPYYISASNQANVGKTTTVQEGHPHGQQSSYYTSYTFSTADGYTFSGHTRLYCEDSVGYYKTHGPWQVWKVTNVVYVKENATYKYYNVTSELIAECSGGSSHTYYRKGSTSYGEIEAEENALPEEGTLIVGSTGGSYCVVKVGSTYYYYEKA